MGATTDKVKGATNEAIGKAKQGIGEATGSDRLKGEGVDSGSQGQGPEGRRRRQGSHQGRRQQGRRRGEQEALIDRSILNGKTGPLGRSLRLAGLSVCR